MGGMEEATEGGRNKGREGRMEFWNWEGGRG